MLEEVIKEVWDMPDQLQLLSKPNLEISHPQIGQLSSKLAKISQVKSVQVLKKNRKLLKIGLDKKNSGRNRHMFLKEILRLE